MVTVAAVQLEAVPGDVGTNLASCERLAVQAGRAGAQIIALPEFFPTGIGFLEDLTTAAMPPDGAAAELLCAVAARHRALVGGSFMCRDGDGHVRNAYLLADPSGIVGRHDKDLPTMWENAFYVGGSDEGVLRAGDRRIGAAVCWELMRTQTVRRLRNRVDLVLAGSGWWSLPSWRPRAVFDRMERRNADTAQRAATEFARYVGAPVVHAGHAGPLRCPMPWLPVPYRGYFEGATVITDADGTIVAQRRRAAGEGIALGEITLGARTPALPSPTGFWLHRRGAVATAAWHYQRWHGKRWYRRNVVTR